MFSPIAPVNSNAGRSSRAAAVQIRPEHPPAAVRTVNEAYEMRLLAEVARWDDQAAFEEIYTSHHAAVTRVALGVCRDAYIAQEITQQTFTALWIRAERLVAKSVRLRPWLTTVARNAAIDHVRAERPSVPAADALEIASSGPTPEDAALAGESKAEIARALASLSSEQRAAIELVYFAGATFAAAADALGEPVGTVKSRVRLALGHLRARLLKNGRSTEYARCQLSLR